MRPNILGLVAWPRASAGELRTGITSDNCKERTGRTACAAAQEPPISTWALLTCRQCKQQFDPSQNKDDACRFHPAHYGGEVKRKWKSHYEAGSVVSDAHGSASIVLQSYSYHQVGIEFLYHTEETRAEEGEVTSFWDCCGRPNQFDPGCCKGPHISYDD
eukprot:SM000059S18735  [mRNA]  locus=s59:646233:647965:- [translate_table: standard]